MRRICVFYCALALGLTATVLPKAYGATLADSEDDWSFDGTQGDNSWFNGYYNLTVDEEDGDGVYQPADFIAFLNDGTNEVWEDELNHWDGDSWRLYRDTADTAGTETGPWTSTDQAGGHPNGTNSAPPILVDDPPFAGEEHWSIRRWVSTYAGEGSIISNLAATNTGCGNGTSVYVYQNGTLLDTVATASGNGVDHTVGATFAMGDVIDFALSPEGVDGARGDSCDGSAFRMTISDEVVVPPPPPFADSEDDWSIDGVQGENNWFNGYYNLTLDDDEEYATEDFQPFFNEFGPAGGPVEPEGNHWNGTIWDMHPTAGPWTTIGVTSTHPNGTNSAPNEEHWTIRRWVADDITTTTPLELNWVMAKTNLDNDGVTGKLFVNGEEVDSATIAGNDGTGVDRRYYINAQPGDVVDLALTPVGVSNDTDGSDGSMNQLIIRTEIPVGAGNPGEIIADSIAEFSGEQSQDGWFYGYYDQLTDALDGDAIYQPEDLILFENDGSGIVSEDDGPGEWKDWGNQWDGGKWDLLNNGVVAHGPWTEVTSGGGHPAANAQGDEEVHWAIRRWVSDYEGDLKISGLLNNGSTSGDGTVGRIFLDGEEIWSEVSDGTSVTVDVDVTLTAGSVLDFAIDPDGSGVFDPDDPEGTIGLVLDGSDGTAFNFRLLEWIPFPAGGIEGDYNGNGELDAGDLDLQANAITEGNDPPAFDLNGDGSVNFADREMWVNELKNTWIGDANLDLEFNSGDMVQVFSRGKYEKPDTAGWEDGDWNGDTKFGSGDMVAAFVAGGYERGPRAEAASAVPEPSALVLALVGLLSLVGMARDRRG